MVDGQSARPGQRPVTTARDVASGTDGRTGAAGQHDTPALVQGPVHRAQPGARSDREGPPLAVVGDRVHTGHVDDDPDVAVGDEVLVAVTAAADRDLQALVDGLLDGPDHLAGGADDADVVGVADPSLVGARYQPLIARVGARHMDRGRGRPAPCRGRCGAGEVLGACGGRGRRRRCAERGQRQRAAGHRGAFHEFPAGHLGHDRTSVRTREKEMWAEVPSSDNARRTIPAMSHEPVTPGQPRTGRPLPALVLLRPGAGDYRGMDGRLNTGRYVLRMTVPNRAA